MKCSRCNRNACGYTENPRNWYCLPCYEEYGKYPLKQSGMVFGGESQQEPQLNRQCEETQKRYQAS